jgi:hypothetical protein
MATGIGIPLLLVIGAIVWWFRCGPAVAAARRTAAWKAEHEQQEEQRNTMKMEENPLVARQRAAAAAAATIAAVAATPTVLVDYVEPAVVGADYEYGPAGAVQAHLYVDPNTMDSAAITDNVAVYEYGPGSATTDNTGVYSLYTGSSAAVATTNTAVYEYGPGSATTDNTGVYSLNTGSTAVRVVPNAKPKKAAAAPAAVPAGTTSGGLVYEMPNAGAPLALIKGVAALQGGAPSPAVVADYEYGSAAAAQAHTYVDPNTRDSATTTANDVVYEYGPGSATTDNTGVYSLYTGSTAATTTNAAVYECGPGSATTDNTGVYSLYTGSVAVQHDDYDMPTADAALDESNL